MADYFYGSMEIYGELGRDKIEGLLEAIEKDDPEIKEKSHAEEILKNIKENECIFIEDHQARYGEFENVEGFCIKNDIPFVRESASFAEFNGERVVFTADGQNKTKTCYLDTHDDSIITVRDVREIISNSQSSDEAIEKINKHLQENDPQMPAEKQKIVLSEDALEFLQDCARLGHSPQSEGMRL